ncbi:unnamed protein product (macronuclear) [Paramecium tetraurelia]|uniref:G-protein coupled receptors family 2 profile 2 domain-containing protein n=1 Tax=Paramecium tetraurelia TaxID=5888 RepID=A0CUI5_PARTE|nr:uncharacterized protein GSPATT00010652001 [Paramecium tetraurelia]CAK74452.1 unnamed protein product [Paramecium tetraurelia]|eukprot:XP_001441849.1 hypothetical protein (macronuclear) [Paramecium tetraurelia strain d4-2]
MTNHIAIISSATLSLIGQMIIVILFFYFTKLRNGLIPRIILYLTIGGIIQTIGILGSSFDELNCTLFGLFRLYGGLSSIIWSSILIYSIKQVVNSSMTQLFMVFNNQNSSEFMDIRDILNKLVKLEMKFCLYSFGLPLLLLTYPLLTALIYDSKNSQLCLFYNIQTDPLLQKMQLNIQKLILWIIPISLYLIYSLSILNRIKHVIKDDQEKQEIYIEVKKLIKQILSFPIITFICTLSFTVEDIQSLFMSQIGLTQTSISLAFLSFWGFLNCLAYLSQDSVRLEIRSRKMSEEQQDM